MDPVALHALAARVGCGLVAGQAATRPVLALDIDARALVGAAILVGLVCLCWWTK